MFTDARTVETSQAYRDTLASKGIVVVQPNPDHIPQFHVERTIQTLQNDITTIIGATPSFTRKHWLPAATFAAELRASCANTKTKMRFQGKSPVEVIERRKPSLTKFMRMTIGDVVVAKTPKNHRKVAVPRNQSGIIEGYQEGVPGAEVRFHKSGLLRRRGHLQKVHDEDEDDRDSDISSKEDESKIDDEETGSEEDEEEEIAQEKQPVEREKRTRSKNVRLREWNQGTKDNGPVTF